MRDTLRSVRLLAGDAATLIDRPEHRLAGSQLGDGRQRRSARAAVGMSERGTTISTRMMGKRTNADDRQTGLGNS
jgi:hypothetical protein